MDFIKNHKKVAWTTMAEHNRYITIILTEDYRFRGGEQKMTFDDMRVAVASVKAARKYRNPLVNVEPKKGGQK